MMRKIGNLSVGDKFTETELVGIWTKIYTVEEFLNNGLVVARDTSGWAKAWDNTDIIFLLATISEQNEES